MRPGFRTRLCHRLRTHPSGKGKPRTISERDFIALIDGTHQLVKAPVVLVWDHLNTHVAHAMRELIAGRAWLTVFLLPACLLARPQPRRVGMGTRQVQSGQPRRRPPGNTRPQPAQTPPVPA
jgi:hypothetical protein